MNPLVKNTTQKHDARLQMSSDDIEIKVLFSSDNPALLGKTFKSQKIQVSRQKLTLEVCREIVLNSVLDMTVTLKNIGRQYRLTGNVRACAPLDKPDHYHLGIVLRERADEPTDFTDWNRNFKNNFKHLS
jgi:hypothetical protein